MAVESVLTRGEVTALFERRQEAFDSLDADALLGDYADDCVVESRVAGTLRGTAAVDRARRAWFEAFPDLKYRTDRLIIDGSMCSRCPFSRSICMNSTASSSCSPRYLRTALSAAFRK